MKIIKVEGINADFIYLCKKLENFQFELLPILQYKDYSLTDDLKDIEGFVLYVEDKPVGSIGLKRISSDVCEIVRVFVEESYRGRNYAGILFEHIEKLAKSMGYKKAEMVAWARAKSALRLYDKMGYTRGEEKFSEWYGGNAYVELYKDL